MARFTMIVGAMVMAFASATAAWGEAAPDYRRDEAWICRPGKAGGCRDDLTTLVIQADGSRRRQAFAPAKAPKVDCFYVYPTVSNGPGISAPSTVSEDERRAVRQQFERFGSLCRLYAPVYRQVTLTSMKASMKGERIPGGDEARRTAEEDVEAAWKTYLARDNHGRGVILIGHSQGAGILRNLIRREIDGRPLQKQLIVAILPGNWVMAPKGRDVGGDFKSISACRHAEQIACVIVFNTYRADHPVPENDVFRSPQGEEPLCTNPAALNGGRGALTPILSAKGETIIPDFTQPQGPWTRPAKAVDAPFVALPGLIQAECRSDEHGVYLAIIADPKPGDRRTGDFTGDWRTGGRSDASMGLHMIDLNLVMGNLLDIVDGQITAYLHAYR